MVKHKYFTVIFHFLRTDKKAKGPKPEFVPLSLIPYLTVAISTPVLWSSSHVYISNQKGQYWKLLQILPKVFLVLSSFTQLLHFCLNRQSISVNIS